MKMLHAIMSELPESLFWLSGYFLGGSIMLASIVKRGSSYSVAYMATVDGQLKWSFSTFQSNRGLTRNYVLPLFGAIRLQELSPLVVGELYREFLGPPGSSILHGKSIKPATLRSIPKLLRSAFEQAVLWEYISRNPFKRADLPSVIPRKQNFLQCKNTDSENSTSCLLCLI